MGIEGKGKVSKRKMPKGDGKIAGQGTRKDTVTTLLFPRAMSQARVLAHAFGECREGRCVPVAHV